jgi:protein-L-isoaspartate O-methyltransferase
MHITDEVKSFLCLSPDNWQMTPGERSALIGLLERLQPRTILEFGTGFGGSTAVFDHYADAVVTVDRESRRTCWRRCGATFP